MTYFTEIKWKVEVFSSHLPAYIFIYKPANIPICLKKASGVFSKRGKCLDTVWIDCIKKSIFRMQTEDVISELECIV